jgi:hypothetical protein
MNAVTILVDTPDTLITSRDHPYSPKDLMILQVEDKRGSYMKNRAMRLLESWKSIRYVDRFNGYVLTKSLGVTFMKFYKAGWDAEFMTERFNPKEEAE